MAKVRTIENAILVPSRQEHAGLGVLDADGGFVAESAIWRDNASLFEPAPPDARGEVVQTLAGTHLYGGILSRHFGHFLVESLARLWPLADPALSVDSVLFLPRNRAHQRRGKLTFQKDVFSIFLPDHPFREIDTVTRVERLIVPEQGFGTGRLDAGTPEFRAYVAGLNWPEPLGDEASRLYVSRSGLGETKGRVLHGAQIDAVMEDHGYRVFRPEAQSIAAQIRAYRAASDLVFEDGSAIHLYGMVADASQNAAIILRRMQHFRGRITGLAQLEAFAGLELAVIDAVAREWRPLGQQAASSKNCGELSPRHLAAGLRGIDPDRFSLSEGDFPFPKPEETFADMARAAFNPIARPKPLPEPPVVTRFLGIDVPDLPLLSKRMLRSLKTGRFGGPMIEAGRAMIAPSDRVLELGAGFGLTGAVLARDCTPEAMLSVEPHPDLCAAAGLVHRANGVEGRIELRQGVVLPGAAVPATIPFVQAPEPLSSHLPDALIDPDGKLLDRRDTAGEETDVPAAALAMLVAEFRPTVLVLNMEGAELAFLKEADLSALRVVIVALHRGLYGRPGMKACRGALEAAGFRKVPEASPRSIDTWQR